MSDISNIELSKDGLLDNSKTFTIKKVDNIPDTIDAVEEKSIVTLDMGREREFSFLKRKVEVTPTFIGFNEDEIPKTPTDKYIFAWKILKERGLPTLSMCRKIDEDHVAVTNLKNYGEIYDIKIDSSLNREPKSTDEYFSSIPSEDVLREADKITSLANNRGVVLPSDGIAHPFVNREDGVMRDVRWEAMIIDLGEIKIFKNAKLLPQDYIDDNNLHKKIWVRMIDKIQRSIKSKLNPESNML